MHFCVLIQSLSLLYQLFKSQTQQKGNVKNKSQVKCYVKKDLHSLSYSVYMFVIDIVI